MPEPVRGFSAVRLRQLRTERGWSMSQLARVSGLRPNQIGMWEAGVYRPSPASLRALADGLGVDPLALLNGTEPTAPTVYHLRIKSGLSRAQLARQLGVSRATIRRIEDGDPVRVTPAMRSRLAMSLGSTGIDVADALERTRRGRQSTAS